MLTSLEPTRAAAPLRVYIVDDSATARHALGRLLTAGGEVEIVGQAANGHRALHDIPGLRPDVVLIDVLMLGLSGLETTRQLMRRHPVPIVLVSDIVGTDSQLNFEGLAAGAVDLMRKPTAREFADASVATAWVRRLRSLAEVPVVTRHGAVSAASTIASTRAPGAVSLVAIGASTGGPRAIERLIRQLGASPPWPVIVVQHIGAGFLAGMCSWLQSSTGAAIDVARSGEIPAPGRYYFAPESRHTSWVRSRLAVSEPTEDQPSPAVDVLFASLARAPIGARTAAVLLTGMGQDGASGLLQLRDAGAWTIAESEASCVIYGMSKVAVELGAAREILTLDDIARRLRKFAYEPT